MGTILIASNPVYKALQDYISLLSFHGPDRESRLEQIRSFFERETIIQSHHL